MNLSDEQGAVPYHGLDPGTVLDAIDTLGVWTDGRLLALNSYENRVYQVGLEGADPVVVKFYRPGRWTTDAILEEHAFAQELADHEIPVVAPQIIAGATLHEYRGFRFAVYPRRGGRSPDLDDSNALEWVGRFLGRLHLVGASKPFRHRRELSIEAMGQQAVETVLSMELIPRHIAEAYATITRDVLIRVQACWERAGAFATLRLHGDCHPGNILWTDAGPHFVDLDDAVTGPAVQDLWMLLSGDRQEMTTQLLDLLAGYEDFNEFDRRELHLIEALRTLRIMNYAAWLARRWHDPAFPLAFPWFGSDRYWEEHVLSLREQAALMDEPPLVV